MSGSEHALHGVKYAMPANHFANVRRSKSVNKQVSYGESWTKKPIWMTSFHTWRLIQKPMPSNGNGREEVESTFIPFSPRTNQAHLPGSDSSSTAEQSYDFAGRNTYSTKDYHKFNPLKRVHVEGGFSLVWQGWLTIKLTIKRRTIKQVYM